MTEAGTTLQSGITKVTTAGTRVQLTGVTEFSAKSIVIQALPENEDSIVVGDKNVVAAKGSHASPTMRGIELEKKQVLAIDLVDSSQVWIDSRKNADGVSYVVLMA